MDGQSDMITYCVVAGNDHILWCTLKTNREHMYHVLPITIYNYEWCQDMHRFNSCVQPRLEPMKETVYLILYKPRP